MKYWNKRFLKYSEQTISIPQNEVGDCSRLLANFYLQCFGIFDLLGDPINKLKVEKAIDQLLLLNRDKCRYDSILRRLLNCKLNKISVDKKIKFLSIVLQNEFLLNSDSRQLIAIYKLLGQREKHSYIEKLRKLSKVARFNSYHYNLLRAKRNGLPISFISEIHNKIEKLRL